MRPAARARMPAGVDWRICTNPDCTVVYFAGPDAPVFHKEDLTVRVGIKERQAPRPVCYCFHHTVEEIEDDIRRTGRTTVLEDIKTRMKEACWCETKNPLGSCCLSIVTRYVRETLQKYGQPHLSASEAEGNCCAAYGRAASGGSRAAMPGCCTPKVGRTIPSPAGTALPTAPRSPYTCTKPRVVPSRASGVAPAPGETLNLGRLSLFGGLLAAVLASACCWLPLVLLAFGVSGMAVSATFEKYRPLLATLTFGLLGTAFYFAYRPRPRAVSGAAVQDDVRGTMPAAGEVCCPPAGERRRTFHYFSRVLLWPVTIAALVLVFLPNWIGPLVGRSSGAGFGPNVDSYVVAVQGMDCPACAVGLEAQLRAVPGVLATKVNYEKQQAVIGVPKGVPPPRDAILQAITRAGFTGHWPPG